MTHVQRHGEQVRLRAIEPDDGPLLAERHNCGGQRLYEAVLLPISQHEARGRAEEASRTPIDDLVELVVETTDGVAVGTATIVTADRRNGVFRAACWIKSEYARYRFRSDGAELLLRFFFDEVGYQKAEVEVEADDDEGVAWAESLGFVVEGRRRQSILAGGEHRDTLLFGLLRDELKARDSTACTDDESTS